jgi:histidyl-tRNA synthetase
MSEAFQAPVGTHDVLGDESARWEGVIATFAQLAYRYGFSMIVTPTFEDVGVFNRGIGEKSEVATKEMYVFEDRGGRSYALRPEGTAPVVRAFVQHNPTPPFKAWYFTPAFRYERPQKGRYREHHQLGAEVLGSEDPAIDIEVISLLNGYFRAVGLKRFRILINSMGHDECRLAYVETLKAYLAARVDSLCAEHQKVWDTNTLRLLDCKKSECISVTDAGPQLPDHLCADCDAHFEKVKYGLDALGIACERAPRLVRGFDYYTRTTFEFVSDALDGAQNAIGGGGRYDKLAEQLGGSPTPGIGFGSGVERLLLALEAEGVTKPLIDRTPSVFVVDTTEDDVATALCYELRAAGIAAVRAYDNRSMKAQMKVADKSGARFALLIGPQELAAGEITIRDLRSAEKVEQASFPRSEVLAEVLLRLGK